jgi:hypothetical protein
MEVKKEMTREMRGGSSKLVVTPETGKVVVRKSKVLLLQWKEADESNSQ